MNKECCEPKYVPGYHRVPHKRPCPYQEHPEQPAPCKPAPELCCKKPDKISLATVTIPANLGTDAEGEPYAPKPGKYFNTIVLYLANGAVYLYDSNGIYTEVEPGGYQELVETVESFQQAINELYNPTKIAFMVKTEEQVQALAPDTVPAGQFVLVTEDETHDNRPYLYYYDTGAAKWVPAYAASPYYEKPFIDSAIANLQTNINNVMNKEMLDVENLQTNINKVSSDLDNYKNSPDVRYIVDTYADLEAIDKATISDQDYARVLQDETHENASTYYQFDKATDSWAYVGQTGPYYTKEQIDTKFDEVPKVPDTMVYDFVAPAGANNPSTADNANITARVVNTTTGNATNATLMMPMASATQAGSITAAEWSKLDSLLAIKSLNDSLELDENGQLSVVGGGGSDVNLLSAYTASPAESDVYDASYVNGRLDNSIVKIGLGIPSSSSGIAIGYNAWATSEGISIGKFTNPTSNNYMGESVQIGYNSSANPGNYVDSCVAIGKTSTAIGAGSVALGVATKATVGSYGVALGAYAVTSRPSEVSFGATAPVHPGAPSTRYLANVTAGELDTDAVNMSQLNAALARITALETEVASLKG